MDFEHSTALANCKTCSIADALKACKDCAFYKVLTGEYKIKLVKKVEERERMKNYVELS